MDSMPLLPYLFIKFPAKRLASFLAIFLVIGFQLGILLMPKLDLRGPYRWQERTNAIRVWIENPSSTTTAALDREEQLENHHSIVMFTTVVGSFLVVDVAMLYVYWRYWVRKGPPNTKQGLTAIAL